MPPSTSRRGLTAFLAGLPVLAGLLANSAKAQSAAPPSPPADMEMLTIFLRHDETNTVDEINQHLKQTGWFKNFPPAGVEIVSWYVMMGIGQVMTLRFPADKLREVNRLIEGEAWGGYRTEFYPTYDYRQLWETLRAQMQ